MSDRPGSLKDRLLEIHKEESASYKDDCVIANNFCKFLVKELKEFENSTGMKITVSLCGDKICVTHTRLAIDIKLTFSVEDGKFKIHETYRTTYCNSEQDVINYIVEQMSYAVRYYNRSKLGIEPGYVPI